MGDLSDHAVCCFRRGASRRAMQSECRPKAVPIKLAPTTKAQRGALAKLEDITRDREFLWATGACVGDAEEAGGSAVARLARLVRAAGEEAVAAATEGCGRHTSATGVLGSAKRLLRAALRLRRDGIEGAEAEWSMLTHRKQITLRKILGDENSDMDDRLRLAVRRLRRMVRWAKPKVDSRAWLADRSMCDKVQAMEKKPMSAAKRAVAVWGARQACQI